MKGCCALLLWIITFQFSYGQQRVVVGASLYGISDNLVYKADTMGNTEWVLDFNGKIKTGISDTNSLNQIASDGRFLYVTSMQSVGSGIVTYYPAIIVLDTLGNTQAIRYWQVNPTGSYFFSSMMANIDGGIWLYDYFTSLSHHLGAEKIDSLGIITNSIGAWMSTDTYFNDMQLLNDSSYMLSTITPFFATGAIGTITKITRAGAPTWRKSIQHNSNNSLYCIPTTSQIDSTGKIVMFIRMTNQTLIEYTVGVILSSTGGLLAQRTWPMNSINAFGEIAFQNNQILYDDGVSIFNFDYTLSDSCLGVGINESILVIPETLQVGSGPVQFFSGFIPTQDSLIQVAPLNTITFPSDSSLDYCLVLEFGELTKEKAFLLYPNPAISSLQIQFDGYGNNWEVDEIKYEIIDINGRLTESGEVKLSNSNIKTVDIGSYKPGIHFVKILTDHEINTSRFIKME